MSLLRLKPLAGVIAAMAVWLSGCAHFEPRPLSPAQAAADFESRSLDHPGLKHFLEKNLKREMAEWPARSWDFKALTFAAFYFHPSLDVARAQWGVAKAGEITAGARPNPTVSVGPQYTVNAARGVSPWLATVDFDIPIETAGKRGYRIARAKHESAAARLNLAMVAWQVRSHLRAALLDFGSADRREKLLRQQIGVQESALQRMEQKLAAGAVASPEVLPLRIALQKSRLDLAEAVRQQADARARVADAIGVPLSALASVELPALPVKLPANVSALTSSGARGMALTNRADILAALADYAASQSSLQLQIAKQYPDLHLGPGYEYDQGENKWGLKLSAELPLLNRNEGPIAEAQARREESAARFTALQARVLSEIDRALTAMHAIEQQLGNLDSLQATQRQQQQSLQKQLEAGAVEPLDLLSAQVEISAGELARHDAQVKRQQALGQLEDALQLPLDFVETALLEQNHRANQESLP